MNPLRNLTDSELLNQTREVARKEQSYSLVLIEHLIEVDARKLFAALGHDSLFKYVVKDLGYSESTAYERIRAMRLVRLVPEVKEKLRTGALTLSSAAQVESFRRQEKLPESQLVSLVEEASNKSLREVEILLLSKSENPLPREKIRQLTPELQTFLRRFEELSGKMPVSQVLERLLERHLQKHDPLNALPEPKQVQKPTAVSAKLCVTAKPRSGSRFISIETKRAIWRRSLGRCEWRNPTTKERCTSRFKLQFDHYPKPYALGGSSQFENLRHACPAHNARFAVEVFGSGVEFDRRRVSQ